MNKHYRAKEGCRTAFIGRDCKAMCEDVAPKSVAGLVVATVGLVGAVLAFFLLAGMLLS